MSENSGHLYGVHRVLLPDDTLPLYAALLDNTAELCRNEILVEVEHLSLHPHFLRSLFSEAHYSAGEVSKALFERIKRYGKLSLGGEGVGFGIAKVVDIGDTYHPVVGAPPKIGDSLFIQTDFAALPLLIESLDAIHFDSCTVDLKGTSFLSPCASTFPLGDFEGKHASLLFLPFHFGNLRHSIEHALKGKRSVLVVGSSRDALICAAMVRDNHPFSSIYGFDTHIGNLDGMRRAGVYDIVAMGDVDDAVTSLDATLKMTGDELVDVVIDATFELNSALSSILPLRNGGTLISANGTAPDTYIRAAHSISRSIDVVTSNQPLYNSITYATEFQYFEKLLTKYDALCALL